jgi:acetyl-CoA carboxylase biotin carboxylase subunit
VHAEDRAKAIERMRRALARTRVRGVATTAGLHDAILAHPDFRAAPVTTRWLEDEMAVREGFPALDSQGSIRPTD